MSMAEEAEVSGHLDYAELALNNGDPASALMAVRDVLACAGRDSPSGSDVRARSLLASALEGTGDLVGAIAELESLVLVVPRDRHWVGLLMVLIRCLRESGDLAGARHTGHEALDEVERAGLADTPEAIRLALTVAGAHNSAGDNLEALRMSERAAERAEAIDSDLSRASAYWQLSVCHYRLGDLATSADLARAALAGFEKVPDPRSQAILRTNLAFTCMRLDHPDLGEAQHHLELAASELAWSPASVVERAGHLQATARLAYLRGDLPRARRSAEEGLTIAAGRSPRVAAACHLTLGQVSLREGDHEAAQDQFHRAVGLLASCGMDRDIAQAWYELGGVLDTVGDTAAALDAYRRAAVSTGQVTPQPAPAPVSPSRPIRVVLAPSAPGTIPRMEPADQGEIASRLDYAELALKNGDPAAALTVVHGVLGAEGGSWALEEPWRARRLLASALEGVGDYADAIAELETLVARVPRDRHWIVLLIALVRCHRESGHLARANRTGHDALREVEQESLGDTEDGVRLMVTVASVHILARDFDGALRLCELAGERADAIGSTIGRASAWWNSCLAYYGRGDLEAAAPLGEAALAAFEASGDLRAQGMLHMNLASIRSGLEPPDLEAADAHVARAESLLSWSEASLVERSKVRSAAAVIEYLRGDLEGARRSIEQCLEMVGESAPNFAAFCLMLLGRVALAESNRVEALSHVETAVLRLAACGQDQEIAAAWFEPGGLLDELGDASGAMDAFRRAAISTGRVSPDLAPARL